MKFEIDFWFLLIWLPLTSLNWVWFFRLFVPPCEFFTLRLVPKWVIHSSATTRIKSLTPTGCEILVACYSCSHKRSVFLNVKDKTEFFFHWSSCHSKLSCCTSKWQMVAFSLNYCFLRSEYSSSLGTLSWEQSSQKINCFIQIRISLSDLRSFENWHFLQFVSFWHNR